MTATEAQAKARRSRKLADRAAFVTLLVAVFSAWGLITGQQLIHPAFGVLGFAAGILAGLAYRSASRWEAAAHKEMLRTRPARTDDEGV